MASLKEEFEVIIVGAGPAGLGVSAFLNKMLIKNVVLEKEDCCGSLWKKRTYDRLNLHLAKEFCALPMMPHANSAPTYLTKKEFIQYLDEYVEKFDINPRFYRCVELAFFNKEEKKWNVDARNVDSGEVESYICDFLVLATGENSECFIPGDLGLETFKGEFIHSNEYKFGEKYRGKQVLVVGCGNSGMEIAYDLSDCGSNPSVVVRSPIHVLTREMVHVGMLLQKYLPVFLVDTLISKYARFRYGNLAEIGIAQPKEGPFFIKTSTGRSPVLDVGTIDKIRVGAIKVLPGISSIKEHTVVFANGEEHPFDAIVFATGYKNTIPKWLKDHNSIFHEDGTLVNEFPNHWKGENGLYCTGFSKRGLFGISMDAKFIVEDIDIVRGKNEE